MNVSPRKQIFFWSLAFAVFIVFVMIFKAVLLPFVLGIAIAYFLNPAVNNLSHGLGISRAHVSLFILCFFVTIIVGILVLSAPILYHEISDLISNLPVYLKKFKLLIDQSSEKLQRRLGFSVSANIGEIIDQNMQGATGIAGQLLAGILAGGYVIVNFISVAIVTPIVAYFMMKEWPVLVFKTRALLPRDYKETILDLLRQIDVKLSGFIRGQLSVAFILGIAYSLALSIAGLKYGFLIGIVSGLLSIIPMVGSTVGFLSSTGVAWFQSGDPYYTAIIASIFLIGQLIEGNILAPKIVGSSVDLHPLWVFFALMAGASLAGILGMLIAVPVAAVASVLCGFAIRQYKKSPYYLEDEPVVNLPKDPEK